MIICFVMSVSGAILGQNLEVYVSAHPDDWQLFMNPKAYESLKNPENKVLFLHTTAGDAGYGMGNDGYALAREEGSLRAIRFMCNTRVENDALGKDMNEQTVEIEGHPVLKYTYANAVSYFLRIPDGNYEGPGYEIHNFTSLRKLYEKTKNSISAIDKSTSYTSIEDLKATLEGLISREAEGKEDIIFNIAETDTTLNPGDHSDHLYSSRIMQDIASRLSVSLIRYYQEYSTSEKPMNVEGANFLISAGTWGATASGLSDMGHYSTWDDIHNVWVGRQYFREEKLR